MSDDYELNMPFERYSNFWRFFNKKYDYDTLMQKEDVNYMFIFASKVPDRTEMESIITSEGYLGEETEWTKIPESCFGNNLFGLTINEGILNSFSIHLDKDSDLDITITGTAIKGYYKNNSFYEDYEQTILIEPVTGNYYYDVKDGTFYYYNGSNYISKSSQEVLNEKPYYTSTGDLGVKCIFLVRKINNNYFVLAYSRFSSIVNMKTNLTIQANSEFVTVGVDESG